MAIMTLESYMAARAYVMAHGRPLDQSRFAFHFGNGAATQVIRALSAYRNEDGGFGQALEPDLRTTASSAIATATALGVLREVDASGQAPLVLAAVRYLVNSIDGVRKVWPIVPPAVEDAPHAPWWSYAESEDTFDGFRINPRASLVGHIYHFTAGEGALGKLLGEVSASLLDAVTNAPDDALGMHDFLAILDLLEADHVPESLRRPLIEKLRRAAPGTVVTDPTRWGEYGLLPLQAAPEPNAPLASAIDRRAIDANLDYLIEQQMADGSWPLAWSWAYVDADAWAQAEREWKGFHAVNHLRWLTAYDRIASK